MDSTGRNKYPDREINSAAVYTGIQEGIQKGIRKKAVETAKILLLKKMPLNEISEITGLTLEEIGKLEK